jgi:hypothetical protein
VLDDLDLPQILAGAHDDWGEERGSRLQGVLSKSHILENRGSLKVQIILAENQNAPQVNLARHVFLAFASGGLGNTPF